MTRASLLVVACLIVPALAAAADPQPVWSTPSLVAETSGDIYEPALAVDQAGRLQLAWSVQLRADAHAQQIDLAGWDGSSWSPPAAVITAPSAGAPSLTGDSFADLHLAWLGTNASLFFTTARAATSTVPVTWSGSVEVAQSNIHAQLRADATGRLHLAYPAHGAGGPMYRASDNGGAWWSEPVTVAAPSATDSAADFARIDAAADGTVHVVWTEFTYPQGWPPRGVFHSRSTDGGDSWTAATPLAGEGFDQINVVALGAQTVHVAWNGMAGVQGRYHRVSHDGGVTWSAPERLVPHGGTEGPPQLLVDAAHTLHVITTYDAAAWHMAWNGERWTSPTCLSCAITPAPTLVEEPTAVIRNGNELHVVFWDARHRLWHTWATLAAPYTVPPPVRAAEWWSSRFWHREATNLPLLVGIACSLALARIIRVRRARRHATIPCPLAGEGEDGGRHGQVPSASLGRIAFFPSAEYLNRNAYWPLLKNALGTAGADVLPSTPMTFGRRWLWEHRGDVRVLHLHFVQPFFAYESVHARLRWVLRFARNLLLARAFGYATVFTLHDLRPSFPLRPAWVDYLGHWVAANLTDRVIVHCTAAATMLRGRYGRRGGVHVIEHPNYLGVYADTMTRGDARARLDLPARERVFLFFGALRPGKGVGALVDAFAALPADDARLVIAGEPHLPDSELERLRARAARDPRLRLELRYIADDDVGVFIAATDVVVLPFAEVLTSASAILAMSFGRPVVAPALGCLPELLADDAGVLYDPAAPDGLLAALRRCLTEDLSAIGAAGFERVRSRTWQAAAAQTIAVYRAALGG